MKNVRLFAVAAAMGMFASTVSAADPVTKESYVATWGNVDEIIKVDVGDKVVMPTAEIKVVKETRTTDTEYATKDDRFTLTDATTCYVGFTNEVGEDENGDGYVDAPFYTAGRTNLTTQLWLHTNAMFFSSAKTALYYVGLGGGSITGGRFLAPGAAANEGTYTLALAHENLGDAAAVIKYFEEKGLITFNYDKAGYISTVEINPIAITNAKDKEIGKVVVRIDSTGHRYSDAVIKEAIVKSLIGGYDALEGRAEDAYRNFFTYDVVGYKNYTAAEEGDMLTYKWYDETNRAYYVATGGDILLVDEIRGEMVPQGVLASGSTISDINGNEIEPVPGKIVVALSNGDRSNTYSKHMTITPATAKKYGVRSEYIWNTETGIFDKKTVAATASDVAGLSGFFWANPNDGDHVATTVGDLGEYGPHVNGLYYVETPANTSDKIVIYTEDLNLDITGINLKNNTVTIKYAPNKELVVDAVKLDGKWYPAVNDEAELEKVMGKILGLTVLEGDTTVDDDEDDLTKTYADSDFDRWVAGFKGAVANPLSGVEAISRTNAEGEMEVYFPQNAYQHYAGTFCTYKVSDGAEVNATVTGNVDAIDTTTAGVKTLTLSAVADGKTVATKDVKVVVAPKYERTYKNGKVVTLKSFHLNGNLYAVYSYDWTAKTYTATFYAQDGVTVAATSNGTL